MAESDQIQDQSISVEPPRRKPRRILRRAAVICLVLVTVAYWFCLRTPPLRVSKETTYALGPMAPDGKRIDYLRAFEKDAYPSEMQTDDNGYRLFVREFGNLALYGRHETNPKTGVYEFHPGDQEHCRLQVYEKLGLDPNLKPTATIQGKDIDPYAYLEELYKRLYESQEDRDTRFDVYRQLSRRWTPELHEMMKEWFPIVDPVLDLLAEAVCKPVFHIPLVQQSESMDIRDFHSLPESQLVRQLARAVQVRAASRLRIGDIDGVIDDILTLHRLARHVGRRNTMTMCLVAIAVEGMATSFPLGANPDAKPTREQIERLLRELDALPPRLSWKEAIRWNRYLDLAQIQEAFYVGFPDQWNKGHRRYLPMHFLLDQNIFLMRANRIYDEMIAERYLDEIKPISRNPFGWLTVRGRSLRFADTMEHEIVPFSEMYGHEAFRRNDCMENLRRLTLALLLYEFDHGSMPSGDWRKAIRPYLGENSDRYFCCPSAELHDDETTYAMIRRESGAIPTTPFTFLLVETTPAMKLHSGDGYVPESVIREGMPSRQKATSKGLNSRHPGVVNGSFRNGSACWISETTSDDEIGKLLDGTAEWYPFN